MRFALLLCGLLCCGEIDPVVAGAGGAGGQSSPGSAGAAGTGGTAGQVAATGGVFGAGGAPALTAATAPVCKGGWMSAAKTCDGEIPGPAGGWQCDVGCVLDGGTASGCVANGVTFCVSSCADCR